MRTTLSLLLIFGVLCCAGRNRVLVVAVGEYPSGSGWGRIHSSNDLELIIPMLRAGGFMQEDVAILKESGATYNAICSAFERLAAEVVPGDRIYIHFSCHGQQMVDDNGDEPDGLDEAMVPYDAPRHYVHGTYEGGRHLRDDRIGEWLDRLREAAGPGGGVIAVFDACHSGTADRGPEEGEYVRGTTYIFGPDGALPLPYIPEKVQYSASSGPGLAPLSVFSACGPGEWNFEYRAADGNYYGTLTVAFTSAAELSYGRDMRFFSELLELKMKELTAGRRRSQNPYIEMTDRSQLFMPRWTDETK